MTVGNQGRGIIEPKEPSVKVCANQGREREIKREKPQHDLSTRKKKVE